MYLVSQICVIIHYVLLTSTYWLKSRKNILLVSFASLAFSFLGFAFLSALTGMAMMSVALVRNLVFYIREKNAKKDNIDIVDWYILIFLYLVTVILSVLTYEGFFSVFSVAATIAYTFSVWQKSPVVYKALGAPVSVLWIVYNFFVKSLFGVILETIVFVCSVLAVIKEKKRPIVNNQIS